MFTQIFYTNPDNIDYIFKQAEAEVVPSSSLVELEVEVWVGVGVVVGVGAWVKMQFSFLTFSVRWVGGWRNGD